MSTRVHELAKKLGLKSQDLIEFAQKEGLDVKPSPLASLDPAMVDRIEELYRKSSGRSPAAAEPRRVQHAREQDTTGSSTAVLEPPAERRRREEPGAIPPTPPAASAPTRPMSQAPQAPSSPGAGMSATPPSAGARTDSGQGLRSSPSSASAPAGGSAGAPQQPQRPSNAPLSAFRSGGASNRNAGPLAGHTPHRGTFSGGSSSEGGQPSGPLKRSDYISPYGTRPADLSNRPPTIGPTPRRPQDGSGTEAPRRDNTQPPRSNKPLPPVAALPTAPSGPRRAEPPRPSGPEGRTQRPDVRFTPEQLREMQRSGQFSAKPGAPGSARPGAPGRPPAGPAKPAAESRPGAPPRTPTTPPTEDEDDRGKSHTRLGSAADRAGRRAERSKRAIERRSISSPMPVAALIDDDDSQGRSRGPRRSGKGHRGAVIAARKTEAVLEPPITIRSLSEAIGVKGTDLIRKLMNLGHGLVTINANLEEDTAMELALEFGVMVSIHHERTAEDELLDAFDAESEESALLPRPPVVTVLGHVDHGKTSLLDRIRQANVVASESGGITQHIGAYQIDHNGHKITFVDTPGHEAFTAMRARGANVTDIVVLVVAADDGMMPQTVEAIAHAKAAEVPVVVALSKIDLPNVESAANINKIYGELAQQGLNPHEWGGETEVIRTSVVTGRGIDDLLSIIEYLAELHQYKSDPNRSAVGTCLEASISEGRGVVANALVQDGTLKVGDVIVCGDGFGRVRAMFNDRGETLQEAGPSTPVTVSGLDSVPTAGERFAVVEDIGRAREIAETRRARGRGGVADKQALTLENLFTRMSERKIKTLNLILKADVQGSIEAITKELEKLKHEEVSIRILHKAVGGITESDVSLAEASDAIIIGFRVAPEDRAITLAEEKKIDIRRYDIIYQVTDQIKQALEGLLVPEEKEVVLGRANVRNVFKISRVGAVAGCFVTRGTIERGARARIFRDEREIYNGTIEALKRFKDDVREVRENFECGIKVSNFDDIKVDDTIEAYRIEVIRRTL